nr:MAG TPA: hypothetical protein [Bacteriophage sp.]
MQYFGDAIVAVETGHNFLQIALLLSRDHLNTPISISVFAASLLTNAQLIASCSVRNFQLISPQAVTQYQPLMICHCIQTSLLPFGNYQAYKKATGGGFRVINTSPDYL